jgi:hypothetical protein
LKLPAFPLDFSTAHFKAVAVIVLLCPGVSTLPLMVCIFWSLALWVAHYGDFPTALCVYYHLIALSWPPVPLYSFSLPVHYLSLRGVLILHSPLTLNKVNQLENLLAMNKGLPLCSCPHSRSNHWNDAQRRLLYTPPGLLFHYTPSRCLPFPSLNSLSLLSKSIPFTPPYRRVV